jgi:oligopeptide transport system substrate-binding protein
VVFNLAGGNAMSMYENDEIEMTGVGVNELERVLDTSNPLNKELIVHEELSTFYFGLNNKVAPFDDPKVRLAFNYATDKELITKTVFKGILPAAYGILPPGMPGYNPNLKVQKFDPTRAKQLLAESKYASGLPEITLSMPGSTSSVPPHIEAIVEMWRSTLGVTVRIQQVEFATFLQEMKPKAAGQPGKYQMYDLGWIADYADPQDYLDLLFHSRSLENNVAYSNPQVDRLLEQARVEQNVERRLAQYQQIEQMIIDEAPWLPTYHGRGHLLIKPYVKGYKPPPMIIPIWAGVSIEK